MRISRRSRNWKVRLVGGLLVAVTLGGSTLAWSAQTNAPGRQTSAPAFALLTSPGLLEVLRLQDAKVDAEVIKAFIKNSSVAYNPSASEIIVLKQRGLSPEMIAAMLERGGELRAQAAQANAAMALPPPYAGATTPGGMAPPYDYGSDYAAYPADYGYGPYGYPGYNYWWYDSWWPGGFGFDSFGHNHFHDFDRFHHGNQFNHFAQGNQFAHGNQFNRFAHGRFNQFNRFGGARFQNDDFNRFSRARFQNFDFNQQAGLNAHNGSFAPGAFAPRGSFAPGAFAPRGSFAPGAFAPGTFSGRSSMSAAHSGAVRSGGGFGGRSMGFAGRGGGGHGGGGHR